jgi:beta-lactamase class A
MVQLHRRTVAALAVATLANPAIGSRAEAREPSRAVTDAIAGFAKLPGASCLVIAEMKDPWKADYEPGARRFVGSALKTFILARYLRDVEEGKRTLAEQLAVNDTARTLNSPVFLNLNGTTTATGVLEAMITHSDNTATDIAMAAVGADRVRALIAEAGLKNTKIADSMRKMFCYLAGLDAGQDAGWPRVKDLVEHPTHPRPALNDVMTMASTADDMVSWYRQSLRSAYFKTRAMIDEFARIQGMATALTQVVPPHIVAYGKGGSIDWQDFHCLSLPGDMVVGATHVTFCFTINWTGPDSGVSDMMRTYVGHVARVLEASAGAAG